MGCSGCSFSSLPTRTGVHSSSRPTSVRISRVLPWPRSPSSTRSWPAMSARSTSGSTVSSNPTIPGRLGSPRPSRASRLSRISAFTGRNIAPPARSSPRVRGAGEGVPCVGTSITSTTVRRRWRVRDPAGPPACEDRRVSGSSEIPLVSGADVEAAAELLGDVVRHTPLWHSRGLADRVGGPVWLKCENLQRTGSFKIRGAYTRISRLTDAERARGVVAASAGNHAQGVALAARLLGAKATVFMPESAPLPKLAATRAYGAEVRLIGQTLTDALVAAAEHAESTGAVFIHPFEHPDVIAGQGTVGLEILEQAPDVRTVVVSAGGGGVVSGIAAAVKDRRPDVRVVAVQAEGAAAFPGSLEAGQPVPLASMATMADGIAVACPGDLTLAHVQALVDEVRTVSEEDMSRALLFCLERAKLAVEPPGRPAGAA